MRHRLQFDMSSLLWQALLVGKDNETGVEYESPEPGKKPIYVNGFGFGFENFVNMVGGYLKRFDAAPRDIVMVFDGVGAKKLRQAIDPLYKSDRSRHPAQYEQFDLLLQKAKSTLLGLGALAVEQGGMEADDVICYLSQHLERSTVITNDGDMLAVINERTDVYITGSGTLCGFETWSETNKYGPFPFRHITLYKALVGDSSDKISGAKGFGPKKFVDLMVAFGFDGLDLFTNLVVTKHLGRLVEDVAECKALQKVLDDQDGVYRSWGCARMYPEKVNTHRAPLQLKAEIIQQWDKSKHDERLKQWYGASRIVHAGNYTDALAWAKPKLHETATLALDIETSTCDESDEWMEAAKRGAGGEEGDRAGVDVLGSELTGLGVTFGKNRQYSLYLTVDHVEEPGCLNVTSEQARGFIELLPEGKEIVVQNASFELSVLYQAWGEAWKDNGFHGFLPNVIDTKLMKSYVDENTSSGLKSMSLSRLGYQQISYDEVTKGRRMNQMTAAETVAYGLDDTICTAQLENELGFWMELEGSWPIYRDVDVDPAYLNAMRFVRGTPISLEKVLELEKIDAEARDAAWATIREYLISKGWEGSVCPIFQAVTDLTPKAIKEAFLILTGEEFVTQVRTPAKLVALIREKDELVASLVEAALAGNLQPLNDLLKARFKGEPVFNTGSTLQLSKLLYETLGLPVRLRNFPTDAMRAKGIREGNPRTDDLTLQFALKFDPDPERDVLIRALQSMKVMQTKSGLYYKPYRHVQHWKTGLVHSHLNQSQTVTRRYSESKPNKQQLPKNPKLGEPARFREVFIPHKKNALVISMDFTGQELITIADRSKDPAMLACYVGDNKKDLHSITGSAIILKKTPEELWRMAGYTPLDGADVDPKVTQAFAEAAERWKNCTYEQFDAGRQDSKHPDHKLLKDLRNLGKKTNFTTEYGAQAPKLSETLVILKSEAQEYIDAKEEAFARAQEWKREVIEQAHERGYSLTLLGARRHLPDLQSSDKYARMRAERQAVNFEIQGSCAEMTKKAEGRVWRSGVFYRYDANYIGPVHDEMVMSCIVPHIIPFITEVHAMMVAPYGGMTVPILSSISFGPSYGEQIEVGDFVDVPRIQEALRSLGFSDTVMTTA